MPNSWLYIIIVAYVGMIVGIGIIGWELFWFLWRHLSITIGWN